MTTLENIKRELNNTTTENGDKAYRSTLNHNLDLFGLMGAVSFGNDKLMDLFNKAYRENEELAIRNLFYLRDIRTGMGRRDDFRTIVSSLATINPEAVCRIAKFIPEYGRWDDVLVLLDNPKTRDCAVELISDQLTLDMLSDETSLLAKWLPSINSKNKDVRKKALMIKDHLQLTNEEYRKILSKLRKKIGIVESKMTDKEYDFDYSQVPSRAMNKYRSAFVRNDGERFTQYLEDLSSGKEGVKVNVKTLYPHEIISIGGSIYGFWNDRTREQDLALMEAQWKALDRGSTDKNTIVVRDGSGSMIGTPLFVSTALAILYSEQLKGEFANKFITFSSTPELISLDGFNTLKEKLNEVYKYNDCSNTNIEQVYNLILKASIGVPEEERIEQVIIVSDMEFDECSDVNMSTYNFIKEQYRKAEIEMPEIVFWNVDAREIHFPTTDKDKVKLVSGYSNAVLQDVLNDNTSTAEEFMLSVLERYKEVSDAYIGL